MKCIIADDHGMVRTGIREVLKSLDSNLDIFEVGSFGKLLQLLETETGIDLILLDLVLAGSHHLEGLQKIMAGHPTVAVVVVSAREEPGLIREAFAMGVSGYIPKSTPPEVLPAAIRLVLDGGIYVPPEALMAMAPKAAPLPPNEQQTGPSDVSITDALSRRQKQILLSMGEGRSNREIALQLDLADQTIKNHVSRIFKVLGVKNRAQAALIARRMRF